MKIKKKNSGQVLFLGIVMVLIIFFAIFLFFDLHNIIRGKIKLETAEQSAALTACRWQAKSLNLIGELNLLIATESVLQNGKITVPADSVLGVENETPEKQIYARGAARIRAINEMQSRITFIGPLIALAATQQAAKNNGINPVSESENTAENEGPQNLADDFKQYINRVENESNIYDAAETLNINGYRWKEPYIAMLKEIVSKGYKATPETVNNGISVNNVVVRPNATIMGIEGIRPSYLADGGLYNAIKACCQGLPAWCQWNLRALVKMNDSYFEGIQWYTPDFSEIRFSQQSEVYPLDVRLEKTLSPEEVSFAQSNMLSSVNYNQFEQQANVLQTTEPVMEYAKILNYTPHFYHYNDRWLRDGEIYTGPIVDTPDTPWRRGEYLNRDVADWAVYGGAVAYAECVERVPEVLPFKSALSQSEANKLAKEGKGRITDLIRKNDINSIQVGGNYTLDRLNTGCVAKPLGKLAGDTNPTKIPVVLPVFTRVNLIPSLMQDIRIFSFEWSLLEKFILALRDIIDEGKTIYDNVKVPEGTEYMLEALQMLGQKEFRRKGYNPEYKEKQEVATDASMRRYFERDNHTYHPKTNPGGPGWLQQPVVRKCSRHNLPEAAYGDVLFRYSRKVAEDMNSKLDPKKDALYSLPPKDEVWVCFKGEYLKVKDGKLQDIMEDDPDDGCGKKSGGNGRLPAGSNMSPERL